MKILLIDMDSKIPNLALMKISAYYKRYFERDEIGFNVNNPDVVYVSSIFSKNRQQVLGLKSFYNAKFNIGGVGINNSKLPVLIEKIKPDYDLYPSTYSQGYTTRGCIRNCPWCVVRTKEGSYKRHQHVKEFHDSRFNTIMIMDNNWLADPNWFMENTDYILKHDLRVLEHGMDIRLLTPELTERLSQLRFPKGMKFAFDQMKDENNVLKGLGLLEDAGVNLKQKVSFYVLTGFNTTPEEDLYRCNLLKEHGTNAFVMRYDMDDVFDRRLAKWANRRHAYWSSTFEEFEKGYWKKSILSS